MRCIKCGHELKAEDKFCEVCGTAAPEAGVPAGEEIGTAPGQGTTENSAEPVTKAKKAAPKGIKLLVILAVIIGVAFALFNRKSDEKIIYELLPEILEEFDCGLGYGEPESPKFKSDDMVITDLNYTEKVSGDTYDMFYVDGVVTVTTVIGTQVPFDYQMRVGLDKEFNKTGKWYAEIVGGDIFW